MIIRGQWGKSIFRLLHGSSLLNKAHQCHQTTHPFDPKAWATLSHPGNGLAAITLHS